MYEYFLYLLINTLYLYNFIIIYYLLFIIYYLLFIIIIYYLLFIIQLIEKIEDETLTIFYIFEVNFFT